MLVVVALWTAVAVVEPWAVEQVGGKAVVSALLCRNGTALLRWRGTVWSMEAEAHTRQLFSKSASRQAKSVAEQEGRQAKSAVKGSSFTSHKSFVYGGSDHSRTSLVNKQKQKRVSGRLLKTAQSFVFLSEKANNGTTCLAENFPRTNQALVTNKTRLRNNTLLTNRAVSTSNAPLTNKMQQRDNTNDGPRLGKQKSLPPEATELKALQKIKIEDIGPPLSYPTSRWWVFVAVVVLVCTGLVGAGLWRKRRNRRSEPAEKEESSPDRPSPAWVEALQRLERLKAYPLSALNQQEVFCVELVEILRWYISKRFELPAEVQTTGELLQLLDRRVRLEREQLQLLREVLEDCDLVKFAAQKKRPERLVQLLEFSQRFVRLTAEQQRETEAQ